jgi:hypothetical protein
VQLPDRIRAAHHWQVGTEFLVEETPEGVLLKPLVADTREHNRIEDVAGCLKSCREHVVSLAEMALPVHAGRGGLANGLDGLNNQALYVAAEHDA